MELVLVILAVIGFAVILPYLIGFFALLLTLVARMFGGDQEDGIRWFLYGLVAIFVASVIVALL